MKVGLFVVSVNPIATPELLAALGRAADERGFSTLWLGEHVVMFDDYEPNYPYSDDGRVGLVGEVGMLDQFATLAFLASATTDIRLGTAVCLVPQRNPVSTAKEAATVDWLSNGRLDLGVGIGWQREEFEALGVPFGERAARTREYLEIMRRLWVDPVSSFSGRFYDLKACRMYPKPLQQPHPPIWFGGESEPALRRVADLGNGWHGFNVTPDAAAAHVARIEALLAERGRSRDEVELAACPYLQPVGPDDVARYADAGIDQLVVIAGVPTIDAVDATLDRLAADYLERARAH